MGESRSRNLRNIFTQIRKKPSMKPYVVFFLLSIFTLACAPKADNSNSEVIQTVPPQKFEDLVRLADSPQLLDVRTPQEYKVGHLSGAQNNNIANAAFIQKAQVLDKNRPVFVYCKTGMRSAHAAQQLEELGFKEVYDLEGGITNWKKTGLPVKMNR